MSAIGTKRTFLASRQCPLLGVKRTSFRLAAMSANDPKRTSGLISFQTVCLIFLNRHPVMKR
jgi:hypothetical protein